MDALTTASLFFFLVVLFLICLSMIDFFVCPKKLASEHVVGLMDALTTPSLFNSSSFSSLSMIEFFYFRKNC